MFSTKKEREKRSWAAMKTTDILKPEQTIDPLEGARTSHNSSTKLIRIYLLIETAATVYIFQPKVTKMLLFWLPFILSSFLFHSGRTMALGSTQPLTEMSTRNLKKRNLGVKCGRRVGLTTLPPSVSRLSKQCGNLNLS
jgi:hypothetical protein